MASILSHVVGPRPQPHAYDRAMRGAQRLRATRTATIAVAAAAVLGRRRGRPRRPPRPSGSGTSWSSATTGPGRPTSSTRGRFRRLARLDVSPTRRSGSPRSRPTPCASSSSTASASSSARATTSSSTTASLARRPLRLLLAAELRRRRRDRPRTKRSRVARPGRRQPRRPHGALARRPPAARLGLHRARRRRHRHPRPPDRRPHPVGRPAPREQLLARRLEDLPREHRHRLHRRRRPVAGRQEGRARLRGHRRPHAEGPQARSTWASELAAYGLGASAAIRPMAIAPDERYAYLQLSFLHGFVEYDLRTMQPTRIALLPPAGRAVGLPRQGDLLDSAMHGLTFNRAGTKLCVAGTMSGYAAVVGRRRWSRSACPRRPACPTGRRRAATGATASSPWPATTACR